MRTYLINFATPDFYSSQNRLNLSAKKYVDDIISYNLDWLKELGFFTENLKILTQKRGAGYWLWKPLIILTMLEKVEYGDVVFYCDSGIDLKKDIKPLILSSDRGIFLFKNDEYVPNSRYTKRDCFILMDCDSEEYWNADQVIAGFGIYTKSKKVMDFVKEWLAYGKDERIITDINNVMGKKNFPDFIEHRWDQSILSILARKYKLKLGNGSDYFLDVHRTRNRGILDNIFYKIKLKTPSKFKESIKRHIYK